MTGWAQRQAEAEESRDSELRRLDALVKEQAQEIERLKAQIDACAPYLKEGETPAKRIERELKDSDALMSLLAAEKRKSIWPAGSSDLHISLLSMGKAMAKERSREIGDAWNQLADLLALLARARGAEQGDSSVWTGASGSAQRVPLTKAQLIDAYCKTPGLHQFVIAFIAGARFAEAAHGIHPLQRLADLSKEIGEKL